MFALSAAAHATTFIRFADVHHTQINPTSETIMASWNSYAPSSWQSQYLPPTDESDQPYVTDETWTDGLTRHPRASAYNATAASLVGNLADLPVAQPVEYIRSRPLYPFLDLPGTAPWADPRTAVPFFGAGSGLTIPNRSSLHSMNGAQLPLFATPDQTNWSYPEAAPVEHPASAQFWPVATLPSPIHGGRLPDDAASPSRNFLTPNTDAVPRDRFADAAQELPEFQRLVPSGALPGGDSRNAGNETPGEAGVTQEARRAAPIRTRFG
jgi:hypothetical protein